MGEALIDVEYPDRSTTGVARPGGSPLNVAVGLARLGQRTSFIGRFSRDPFGAVLRRHAADNEVDLANSVLTEQPSTVALVSLDAAGAAAYDFSVAGAADFGWTAKEIHLPDRITMLHFGSLASWLPPGDEAIAAAAGKARDQGALISYDPNIRPTLHRPPVRAQRRVEDCIRLAHVVKASEDDVAYLYPQADPADVALRWLDLGADLVAVTHGSAGCTCWTRTVTVRRRSPAVDVVDTVGAGDGFTAGMLDALVRHGLDDVSLQRDRPDLEDVLARVLDHAGLVSSMTCERAGADPPRRDEVAARLADRSRSSSL